MRELPDRSIDMILCDLPYGILNRGNQAAKWDSQIPFEPLWEQYKRLIIHNGAIVLFGQGMFTAKLIMSNPKMWRYNLVWKKGGRCSGFLNAKRQPLRNHEDIIVFAKKQTIYHPQMRKCEPHQRTHSRGKLLNKGTNRCYGEFKDMPTIVSDEKYPLSVLDFKQDFPPKHPTQKPVALLEYLIRTYTGEGMTVLDNCMGCGSTCIAAINTGRNYIGFELDKDYYEMSKLRISETIEKKIKNNAINY